MDILSAAKKRYSAKAYDPTRHVPEDTMQQIYEVLRVSPSSVNSQPWHFIVASTPEGKARMLKGVAGKHAYNEAKIRDASHVILFCARVGTDGGHLDKLLEQEGRDGRFKDDDAKAAQAKGRKGYMDLHRYAMKDMPQWFEKQVYIALGNAMLAAATLEVDTTPMGRHRPGRAGRGVRLARAGLVEPRAAELRLPRRRRLQRQAAEVAPAARAGLHLPLIDVRATIPHGRSLGNQARSSRLRKPRALGQLPVCQSSRRAQRCASASLAKPPRWNSEQRRLGTRCMRITLRKAPSPVWSFRRAGRGCARMR